MSDDASGGDDLAGLSGFFFYVFIVHPATAWILRPGRFERKKSIMYAIAFLALLASVKTGLELNAKGPNHYVKLSVTRSSNPLAIKRAYKKLSLQLHPDKNPSPTASDEFDEVKQAYDVLMDMEFREVYNKFGQEGINSNKRFDETQFFIELAVFYLTWGMMVFVLTLGKKSGDARQWCFTGMIVMLVVEIAIMTSQSNPLPTSLFPQSTEYEVVWLMHSLFPAFMNGCRSLGAFLYVDLDAQARQLLLALQEQNKDILLVLRDVQIGVQSVQANGGGSGGRLAAGGLSTVGAPMQVGVPMRATPTGKLKELQDRLQSSNTSVVKAVDELKSEGSKNSSFGFYAMIMGYIAFSYLFSK
uniref:J domain-containing protein n=1 Tax=Odontella aurita TaxID=265563 RepID=A0A7S4K575_9STRA|mmetsp:Transcript_62039/g.183254  ORF Transcript_62039/g.183254 Transcript_62039/m.183254 type:complete len:358 (+) Transcript_62039:212-1285(+)